MKRLPQTNRASTDSPRRSGQAQIELALFLPLLAMMWMMIFTCGNAVVSRMNVSVTARDKTWRQRYENTDASRSVNHESQVTDNRTANHEYSLQSNATVAASERDDDTQLSSSTQFSRVRLPGFDDLGQVLNHGYQNRFKDLVEGTAEQKAEIFIRLVGLDNEIQVQHSVMRGAWDFSAITFQPKSLHKTLIADPKFHRFDSSFKLDWLRALLSQAAGASDSLERLRKTIRQARRALAKIKSQIEQKKAEIARLVRQIERLKNRIDELKAAIEAGDERDSLRGEMSRLERTVREIQDRISQIKAALNTLYEAKQTVVELMSALT